MKVGDVVRVRGTMEGYRDTFTVISAFTNDKGDGDDVVCITWLEPHSHNVRTQVVPVHCLEVVPQKKSEAA